MSAPTSAPFMTLTEARAEAERRGDNLLKTALGPVEERGECWVWHGRLKQHRFPVVVANRDGRLVDLTPRRVVWEALVEPIGAVALRTTCGHSACIRPSHFKFGIRKGGRPPRPAVILVQKIARARDYAVRTFDGDALPESIRPSAIVIILEPRGRSRREGNDR